MKVLKGKSTLGQEYSMNLIENNIAISDDKIPVFFDGEQNPYDKFYNKVVNKNYLKNFKPKSSNLFFNVFSHESIQPIYDISMPLLKFPDYRKYKSNEKFVFAVQEWLHQKNQYCSTMMLPYPISGIFYIPKLPKLWSKEELKLPVKSRFKSFKLETWTLLPKNYLVMINMLFDGKDINPEQEFPDQIPNRPPILNKYYITSEKQWQSQLIPFEPEPIIYDKFEDFEKAYTGWASVLSKGIKIPIISPEQLGKIASLDKVHNNSSTYKIHVQKNELFFDFNEWSKISPPNKVVDLNELKENELRKMEFNFHENHFVSELINYGYDIELISKNKPILISKLIGYDEDNPIIDISKRELNISLFKDLLKVNYSDEQLNILMSTKIKNDKTLITNFENDLDKNILQCLKLQMVSINHCERLCAFFRAFIRNTTNVNIFKSFILRNMGKPLMYEFVSSLIYVNKVNLLKLENKSKFGDIVHFFTISVLNDVIVKEKSILMFETIKILRLLEYDVSKRLRNVNELEELRSNNFYALMMLLYCCSKSIHTQILGYNFIKWINNLSKDHKKSMLILSFIHSDAIVAATSLYLKNLSKLKPNEIEDYTDLTCYLIRFMNDYLVNSKDKHLMRCNYNKILKLLELTALSKSKSAVGIASSLSKIVFDKTLLKNCTQINLKAITAKIIVLTCKSTEEEDSFFYKKYILLLTDFVKDPNSFEAMKQIRSFIEVLSRHFVNEDPEVSQKSWNLFKLLTSDKKEIENALAIPSVQQKLYLIPKEDDFIGLKNLLELSIKIIQGNNFELQDKICSIIHSFSGKLISIVTSRSHKLSGNSYMRSLIFEFLYVVYTSESPKITDLRNGMIKSIGSEKDLQLLFKLHKVKYI